MISTFVHYSHNFLPFRIEKVPAGGISPLFVWTKYKVKRGQPIKKQNLIFYKHRDVNWWRKCETTFDLVTPIPYILKPFNHSKCFLSPKWILANIASAVAITGISLLDDLPHIKNSRVQSISVLAFRRDTIYKRVLHFRLFRFKSK